MTNRSDLIKRAEDLRKQAERDVNNTTHELLIRMADRYVHLAESRAASDAHPLSAASVSDIFTIKQN